MGWKITRTLTNFLSEDEPMPSCSYIKQPSYGTLRSRATPTQVGHHYNGNNCLHYHTQWGMPVHLCSWQHAGMMDDLIKWSHVTDVLQIVAGCRCSCLAHRHLLAPVINSAQPTLLPAHYRTCLHSLFWLTLLWSCHNNSCMRSPWQQSTRISWKWRSLNVRNSLQAFARHRYTGRALASYRFIYG